MAYVNYRNPDKDDMQDQTYMILTELLIDAIRAYRDKDANTLHSDIDSIFLLLHNRMGKEDAEKFDAEIEEIDIILHGELRGDDPRELVQTECVIRLRTLLKAITKVLDEKGILLKMRADLDALVAGG